jgi:hypothetical protein
MAQQTKAAKERERKRLQGTSTTTGGVTTVTRGKPKGGKFEQAKHRPKGGLGAMAKRQKAAKAARKSKPKIKSDPELGRGLSTMSIAQIKKVLKQRQKQRKKN